MASTRRRFTKRELFGLLYEAVVWGEENPQTFNERLAGALDRESNTINPAASQ